MKNKHIIQQRRMIWIIAVLIFVGLLFFLFMRPSEDRNMIGPLTFTSAQTDESITVRFDTEHDTAILTGLGHTNMVFAHAISASGARYVNEDTGLELWNKGNEITLFEDSEPIFVGYISEINDGVLLHDTQLSEYTWVWVETHQEDETIVPAAENADRFTITFSTDPQDMRVIGTTDCNNFSGTYILGTDGALTFGSIASTLMYCEGSQEGEFMRMVAEARHYLFTEEGNLMLRFPHESGTILFARQ